MSSIVQELRTSKRQLTEKFDGSRRHGGTGVADDNNNDNYNSTLSSSQLQTGSAGGLWNNWRPAVTPTASAARRRTGQSRSKRRHGPAELCFDEHGALDLTSAKKAVRTSSTAPRRPSVLPSAAMNLGDSVPLDLTTGSRVPYVVTLHCLLSLSLFDCSFCKRFVLRVTTQSTVCIQAMFDSTKNALQHFCRCFTHTHTHIFIHRKRQKTKI